MEYGGGLHYFLGSILNRTYGLSTQRRLWRERGFQRLKTPHYPRHFPRHVLVMRSLP